MANNIKDDKMKITKKALLGAAAVGSGAAVSVLLLKLLKKKRKQLNVDFDGTITTGEFPEAGPPQKGCRQALQKLIKDYDVVIHTCRTASYWKKVGQDPRKHIKFVKDYMKKYKLPYTRIELKCDKPFAEYYIDDRGIEFTTWDEVIKTIGAKNEGKV